METMKKRQKATARREKQQMKAARRLERKKEKANAEQKPLDESPVTAGSGPMPGDLGT